ncbi:RsmB/NOP family class I SAM-dependent RNA methyltransferase [Hugenholtzia roseola]|uniref:RsmB/NOP family class I SAM-dependent RNA methyltransferase n=1 Tax=Hugenholtzia roseola TaxID=1002 RepID=UPI000A326699
MAIKIHQTLVDAIASALFQIFVEKKYADKVIEKLLRSNPKWGARDRAFIAENSYDIVRSWRKILYVGKGLFHFLDAELAYSQLLEKERPADSLLKQDFRLAAEIGLTLKMEAALFAALPTARLLDQQAQLGAAFEDRHTQDKDRRSLLRQYFHALPTWLDALLVEELGQARWEAELEALNQTAPVVLRANALKISVSDLEKRLDEEGIETQRWQTWASGKSPLLGTEAALVLQKRQNIFRHAAFQEGLFEVQDAGSQSIAPFLEVEMGMRLVDACAGAGGKTLHLAALMQNKGKIIALDTESWKLAELQKRAKRAGASLIETRPIEGSKTIKRLYQTADRLLLDVPCSGLGVLRRNPDAKWKLKPQFIATIRQTQAEILDKYTPICKVGGKVVYATCSILPSENEKQVQLFLEKHKEKFSLLKSQSLTPAQKGTDGFFMALLERKK